MYKLIILTFLSLFIVSCNKSNKVKPISSIDETNLRETVINAINGKRIYNDSLSGLIDYTLPLNSNYDDLQIARIITPINKTFFAILLEYPNPVYNRFAVYDSVLHLILMDKSLNGKIGLKSFNLNNRQYIEIDESYLSKDIIEISRISLYNADSIVTLGFRTFTKFITPTNEYYQIITEISPERIKTNITSIKKSLINDKSETLGRYNQNKYSGQNNIFTNFIKDNIARFKRVTHQPSITDENSILESVGISKVSDTIKVASFISNRLGYYLNIDEGWKEIRDIGLYGFANKLRGNKYYNPLMGTNIFIAQIPDKDSAEIYIKTGLPNIKQGKYRVRFTDKIEKMKSYIQYFEFSCGERKYLMIFEASKYTYEKYKTTFQDIINSFVIEC
jgi:hypothetical protein